MRVLVTGACGWTAAPIVEALGAAGHAVDGVDLPGVDPDAASGLRALHRCDVADLDALGGLCECMDAVVHLAVAVGPNDYHSPEVPLRTNVAGTHAVLEAARRTGVRRVVLMGSAPVHLTHATGARLDARDALPVDAGDDFLYDLTKRLQEDIARAFCAAHGMSAVTLRAGHIVDGRSGCDPAGRSLSELDYCRGGWVCRHDVARAVLAALRLDREGYQAFHVIGSRGADQRFDVARTWAALGMRPSVDFDAYE